MLTGYTRTHKHRSIGVREWGTDWHFLPACAYRFYPKNSGIALSYFSSNFNKIITLPVDVSVIIVEECTHCRPWSDAAFCVTKSPKSVDTICLCLFVRTLGMGRTMRKCVFRHMRTVKAQISLRIRAVWSGPSLSAYRIIGHYRMYQWRANIRMRLRMRGMNVHFTHARRHIFAWRGPNTILWKILFLLLIYFLQEVGAG